MITINATREWTPGVEGRGGYATCYNASGKGKAVATVDGPVAVCDLGFGCDGGLIDGQSWALRDVLDMAKRGERGLSLVEA